MREDDSNWFSRWEEQLPPPEELMPLSQTLITPDLAIAFDIRNPHTTNTINANPQHQQLQHHQQQQQPPPSSLPSSTDFADSGELGSGTAGEEPARTLKRPRLVWTPQLHKRFVDAVAHLGIKNAVPKTIMQLMSVDGLTRENVASHLQKYRLYLKRMQGISSAGGGGSGGGSVGVNDPATDHLFASSPVPPHFLHPVARPNPDQYMPFVPVPAIHHQQQLAAAQYHRPVGHFGSPPNGHFDNPFLSRQHQQQHQHQQQLHRIGAQMHHNPVGGYVEDMESANASGGRKNVVSPTHNFEDYQVCAIIVGVVGDVSRALEEKILPYCDGIMTQLLKDLSSNQLHRSVKPPIFSCFGDIALAIGENFEKYLLYSMPMLQSAAELSAHTAGADDDMIEYTNTLRNGILEAYSGIFQGFKGSPKTHLLMPYTPHVLQFLDSLYLEKDMDDVVTKTAIGVLGDLADTLGGAAGPLIQQSVSSKDFLKECLSSDDHLIKESAEWAKLTLSRAISLPSY